MTGTRVRDGFTLTELLVVMVVIAMLVAILLPALGRAQESARRTICRSNLRQIGMAYQMFCDDHANFGYAPPNYEPCIIEPPTDLPGPFFCSTAAAGDDVQVVPAGNAVSGPYVMPGHVLIRPGDNGVLDTTPLGNDIVHNQTWEASNVFFRADWAAPGQGGYSGLGLLLEYMTEEHGLGMLFCPSADIRFTYGRSVTPVRRQTAEDTYVAMLIAEGNQQMQSQTTAHCSYLYRGFDQIFLTVGDTSLPGGRRLEPRRQRNIDFGQRNGSFEHVIMEPVEGGNGSVDYAVIGDDIQVFAFATLVGPGVVVVRPGPNGVLNTPPDPNPARDDVFCYVATAPVVGEPRMVAMDYCWQKVDDNSTTGSDDDMDDDITITVSNHDNGYVNILFTDGHVSGFRNTSRPGFFQSDRREPAHRIYTIEEIGYTACIADTGPPAVEWDFSDSDTRLEALDYVIRWADVAE